jgi:hypothetical protein
MPHDFVDNVMSRCLSFGKKEIHDFTNYAIEFGNTANGEGWPANIAR